MDAVYFLKLKLSLRFLQISMLPIYLYLWAGILACRGWPFFSYAFIAINILCKVGEDYFITARFKGLCKMNDLLVRKIFHNLPTLAFSQEKKMAHFGSASLRCLNFCCYLVRQALFFGSTLVTAY